MLNINWYLWENAYLSHLVVTVNVVNGASFNHAEVFSLSFYGVFANHEDPGSSQ